MRIWGCAMKHVGQVLGVSLFLLLLAGSSFAQTTGQITGTVHDPSGANVGNAQVKVSSPERGITRETATNSSGEYLVSGLPAGNYDLTVTAPGFKTYLAKGIVLRVAQKTRADAELQVGGATSEVTVEGSGIGQVETQSSEMSGVITGKEISQLQLNGGRTEYNNWELDGGDNMDNGSNSSLNVYPSVDAIAEVKVLTSNYGAQYGRSGSGTVEVETKSGTSSFHGSAYEFVRNTAFNARNYFQSYVPQYNKNDFGYTFGGPIFIPGHYNTDKQKTFFFWSQEWRIERVPGQIFNTPVPPMPSARGTSTTYAPTPPAGRLPIARSIRRPANTSPTTRCRLIRQAQRCCL